MIKSEKYKKFKARMKYKHPRIYLLLRTINQEIHGDDRYVQKVLAFKETPDSDFLDIRHNGSTNYEKTLYVIKENSDREGFCATLRFTIGFILYAKEHGFEPVMRLSKDFVYYDEEMSMEISNPWKYYFLAPKDVYDENEAMHVCYCQYYHMMTIKEYEKLDAYRTDNYYDESLFKACTPVIKEYMEIKPEIVNEATEFINTAKDGDGIILGVHFRGTDYKKGYNEHPVFVGAKKTIEEIEKAMEKQKVRAIFVATDDTSFCNEVKKKIGDIEVLQYQDVYRSDGDESVAFSKSDRKKHHYLLGYEILRDMYTLSLCDGLIAGKSSVGFISNLYKHSRDEEYVYMHIIDKGNNSNEKNF